jgi:hypothetical protein
LQPTQCAPVAQLDRAFGYEPKGRRFESFRAHHHFQIRYNCTRDKNAPGPKTGAFRLRQKNAYNRLIHNFLQLTNLNATSYSHQRSATKNKKRSTLKYPRRMGGLKPGDNEKP